MRVLVVGVNGDVGSRVARLLLERGVHVRGTVRDPARAGGLAEAGVEVVTADLTQRDPWDEVVAHVDVAVLTANPITPRAGDVPADVEAGLSRLVGELAAGGVRRVVLPSVPVGPVDDRVPFARARRALEERVAASGLEPAVVRFPPFMGCWLALVGSSIPLRGQPHATIARPSPFLRTFRRRTGRLVEDRGLMLVPGPGHGRNAFIDEADAARALVEVATGDEVSRAPVEVGGPEVLSWRDVADTFAELLGRRVRILSTPTPVYAAMQQLMRPAGPVPSGTMGLNRFLAATETAWPAGGGVLDPASMTTVRDFLASRLALPDEVPTVG